MASAPSSVTPGIAIDSFGCGDMGGGPVLACINDHDFLDPSARAVSLALARRGITMPQEMKLQPGQILYRFGHSTATYESGIGGLWWMSDATFEHVRDVARKAFPNMREDRAVRQIYRQKLAVPGLFGPSDVIIRASVASPLRVWTGRGKAVSGGQGEQARFLGAFEVAQICIPALMLKQGEDKWVRNPLYDRMLTNVVARPAESVLTG